MSNLTGTVEELLGTLYQMVQDAWSLPIGADKCVLERDKVLDILDEINNQLPSEFKQAKTVVDARNEIINSAKREAEAMMQQAEAKARELIAQDVLHVQAAQEADNMLKDAEEQCARMNAVTEKHLRDLKTASMNYLLEALKSTEGTIGEALKSITTAENQFNEILKQNANKEEGEA